MNQITAKTRQGNPVLRLSKTAARKRFYAGQAITSTQAGMLPDSDPDVFHDDGTDKMMWPSITDFDSWANEQAFYAHRGQVWWWGFDTPSGLAEGPEPEPLIGLELPAESGTKVRVVPSPFDSAPDYVGLTGTIERILTKWEIPDGPCKGWRTQYRVVMDETPANMIILRNPPTSALGPLWNVEGPYSFIMLDHELERIGA